MEQNRLQLEFEKSLDIKGTLAATRRSFREIRNVQEYIDVVEQIKALNVKKAQFEERAKEQVPDVEKYAAELKAQQELLTDLAINQVREAPEGTTLVVRDPSGNEYAPHFKVKFEKLKGPTDPAAKK